MANIRFGDKTVPLPASRIARIILGVLLVLGGFMWFLPVLGLWMLPLGLIVLSIDFPVVRRWRRQATVRFGGWLKRRFPALAARLGFKNGNGRMPGEPAPSQNGAPSPSP